MRALRVITPLLMVFSLLAGTNATVLASPAEPAAPIRPVAGTLDVHQLPGGTFAVEDRVFQYRQYVMAGPATHFSDPILGGYLLADWNWDVQASGDRPVPAWGQITIAGEDGSWSGSFSGIRASDFQPLDVRTSALRRGGVRRPLCRRSTSRWRTLPGMAPGSSRASSTRSTWPAEHGSRWCARPRCQGGDPATGSQPGAPAGPRGRVRAHPA